VRVDPFFFTYLTRRDWRQRPERVAAPPGRSSRRRPLKLGGSRKPWWLRRAMQGLYGGVFRMKARRYQLYHEPNHIPMRCDLPTVTTIHDLSAIVHPEWHPADRVRWYEREFAAGVRQTRRFLVASEFTKREMIERLNVPGEIIDVTYQAPRGAFGPREPGRIRSTLAKLNLPGRFFLYVGTLEPRKNVPGLLDAYAALPAAVRRELPLVVVGAWGWKQAELRAKLAERSLSSDVRLMGFIADEELACLYAACTAFVWPTLYEGFGNPPLEAMACGAPAVVSNVASLPEVVGEAGILLDPHDPLAWTDSMRRLAEDPAWRETRIRASREQAARFSWERCARQTAACYYAALDVSSVV
jgi:glycosyltransferase involved in cell wall biosynthesis